MGSFGVHKSDSGKMRLEMWSGPTKSLGALLEDMVLVPGHSGAVGSGQAWEGHCTGEQIWSQKTQSGLIVLPCISYVALDSLLRFSESQIPYRKHA